MLHLGDFLHSYELHRKGDPHVNFDIASEELLRDSIDLKRLDQNTHERLSAFFSFALCSSDSFQMRSIALKTISHFANDFSNRCVLVSEFSILKSLIYGACNWIEDELALRALEAFHKCTLELDCMDVDVVDDILVWSCRKALSILKNPPNSSNIETALGILANVCRRNSAIHQAFRNKDDFDLFRKLLLRFMNDVPSSTTQIILSLTITFHLWGTSDKFFTPKNVHKSLQILFNIFLSGDSALDRLYAGDLLVDICQNPELFAMVNSHPSFQQFICDILQHIANGNSENFQKCLTFLTCLLKNNPQSCAFIRRMFFKSYPPNDSNALLAVIGNCLVHPSDHFLAASTAAFLFALESSFSSSCTPDVDYADTLLALLEVLARSLATTLEYNNPIEVGSRRRVVMRCASLVVQKVEQNCHSFDSESLEIIASRIDSLGQNAREIAQNILDSDSALVKFLLGTTNLNELGDRVVPDHNSLNTVMLVTVDALDLLLSCVDFFSTSAPIGASQKSQENIDPDETRIDCTPPLANLRLTENLTTSGRLRCFGDALQNFLESPPLAPIMAILLVTSCAEIGTVFSSREAILRLLRVALGLQGFSNFAFLSTLSTILPDGCRSLGDYVESRLLSVVEGRSCSRPYFVSQWMGITQPGIARGKRRSPGHGTQKSDTRCSEATLEKLIAALGNSTLSFASTSGSEAMTICQRRIEALQSREAVLEAEVREKTEALRRADGVAEHFRSLARSAEAEVAHLLRIQTRALAHAEDQQASLASFQQRIQQMQSENSRLSTELSSVRKEFEDLRTSKASLQSKLAAMREQNRSMDATIDSFRKQLDEAKEVIRQKDAEIQQYNQMAKIINELTGNKVASANTSNLKTSG